MKASKAGDHFLLSLGGKGLTDRYNCKEKLDACHSENKKGEESRFTKKKTCFEQICYVFMHKKFRMPNLVIFIS